MLIFIANTCLYVGRLNIADLKISDDFRSGENLLVGQVKKFAGQVHFQSIRHGANELKKNSGHSPQSQKKAFLMFPGISDD